MTQVNNSIFPEIQAAINKNELMVVGQFLIVPNLRDCCQENLEVFGQAVEIFSDRCWLLENYEHKKLEHQF